MNKRIAILILAVALAAQVQAPAPALTCKIMRFGSGKPTCLCRGDNRHSRRGVDDMRPQPQEATR